MAYRNLVITEPRLMSGDDVRRLQEAINRRAKDTFYPPVKVDGVFGHWTLDAARREGRLIGAADLQLSGPVRARLQMILRDPRRRSPEERRRGIRRYRERREQIRREATSGRPVRAGEKYSDDRGRLWKVDADDAPHLVWFDGKPVARWIAPLLTQARREGWGGHVTNGWRSYAHQYDIYYVHKIRPAAKPGESNHQGSVSPRGAVDVTDWDGLRDALRRVQGGAQLRWYGTGDPPHFSATGR